VRVEGDLGVQDLWRVKPGTPVEVQLTLEGANLDVEKKTFRGHIGFVDVIANSLGRTRFWAEVPNPDNILRPGLKATMTIFPGASTAGSDKSAGRSPGGPAPAGADAATTPRLP
jgi:hypothetical protein